jgi:hypothetical protein
MNEIEKLGRPLVRFAVLADLCWTGAEAPERVRLGAQDGPSLYPCRTQGRSSLKCC